MGKKIIFDCIPYKANLNFIQDTMNQLADAEFEITLENVKKMGLTKEEEDNYMINHMDGFFTGFIGAVGTLIDEHLADDLIYTGPYGVTKKEEE